jgi:hypothetical protein
VQALIKSNIAITQHRYGDTNNEEESDHGGLNLCARAFTLRRYSFGSDKDRYYSRDGNDLRRLCPLGRAGVK